MWMQRQASQAGCRLWMTEPAGQAEEQMRMEYMIRRGTGAMIIAPVSLRKMVAGGSRSRAIEGQCSGSASSSDSASTAIQSGFTGGPVKRRCRNR